jgi:hypothetical protein
MAPNPASFSLVKKNSRGAVNISRSSVVADGASFNPTSTKNRSNGPPPLPDFEAT